jgi:TM2 domain-containing membrane protein YozV
MGLTDEEKNRIIEEEKVRLKIRLKYEQKSSGLAGVLSSVCPGLGQIYNGQFGKATSIGLTIIISIVLLSLGITFWVKGVPSKGVGISVIEENKPVQMTEEGVVIEEEAKEKETPKAKESKPKSPYILTIIGLVGLCYGWSFAVNDAIKTAKRLNEEAIKDL